MSKEERNRHALRVGLAAMKAIHDAAAANLSTEDLAVVDKHVANGKTLTAVVSMTATHAEVSLALLGPDLLDNVIMFKAEAELGIDRSAMN